MTNMIRNKTGKRPAGETQRKSRGAEQGAWARGEQRKSGDRSEGG